MLPNPEFRPFNAAQSFCTGRNCALKQAAGLPLVPRPVCQKDLETFESVMWLGDSREPSPYSIIWTDPDRRIVCPDWPLQNAISTATTLFKVPPISDVVGHAAWVTVVPWSLQPEFYRVSRFFLGLTENHVPLMTKLCQPTRPQAARVFARFFQYPWRMASSVPYLVENVLKFIPGVGYLTDTGSCDPLRLTALLTGIPRYASIPTLLVCRCLAEVCVGSEPCSGILGVLVLHSCRRAVRWRACYTKENQKLSSRSHVCRCRESS